MLETKSVDDNFSMLVTQHRKSMSKSLLTSMLTIKLVIFHVGDTIKMLVHHADVLRKLVIRFGCWRYLINVGNMTEIRATAYRL